MNQIDISWLDVDGLRALLARIEGRLAELAGKPLVLRCEYGPEHDRPPGGAVLCTSWATYRHGHDRDWYPTADAARAALLALARREGRAPEPHGWSVDLTSPGCCESSAWIDVEEPVLAGVAP